MKELHIFDENIIFKQKISCAEFKTTLSISCSQDGSVTILSDQNHVYYFAYSPESENYEWKRRTTNFIPTYVTDPAVFCKEPFLLIEEN